MRNISIIIPVNSEKIDIKNYVFRIDAALKDLSRGTLSRIGNYEIIVATNFRVDASLQDINLTDNKVKIYTDSDQKNISGLSIKGISMAQYEFIGLMDVNTDYSEETLEKIVVEMSRGSDVIAAFKTNPQIFKDKGNSKEFSSITNKFLFKLRTNHQNGALFFSKKVWEAIEFVPSSESIFSIEFLIRAQEAGFSLKKYVIYQEEKTGKTKFSLKNSAGALRDVISLKTKEIPPVLIPSIDNESMINAGYRYKKKKYVTHTTLNAKDSAVGVLNLKQFIIYGIFLEIAGIGLFLNPLLFGQIIIGLLSTIYLIDVLFNLYLVFKTMRGSHELKSSKEEQEALLEDELPTYSILCPMYKEAHMLPQFLNGIDKLDWSKNKLDVMLLLEEDDLDSIKAFKEMDKPEYLRSIIVPASLPKTKPKACNYGLAFAKGEYVVIFDAEDIPDPMQLKKAYLGFKKSDRSVVCLQAKLSYYNIHQNLLTRFFTAEYSLWFGMTLTGLQALNTTIPLGGTSNHFRTVDLQELHAWDPFNVTEDADLGMRLFRMGYKTAVIDSVTLEEGNSKVGNWLRQRSRWIKGYMQTYLVHTRGNVKFVKEQGIHAFIFHLIIGGKIAFIFINPLLWIITILYFSLRFAIGPVIDMFYPQLVLYIAITSLIFGNYLYLFCYIMGCVKTEQWGLIKYVFLIPLYWVLISIAGAMAMYQLIFRPFYWEKTVHGLHFNKDKPDNLIEA